MRPSFPLLLLLCLALAACEEPPHEIAIEEFHAEIEVRADGTTQVTERLEIDFVGAWNGIFREISLQHRTARGRRERLRLEVHAVTDGAGAPLEWESRPRGERREVQIWIPGAEDTRRTVVIRYTVENALRFFQASDRPGGHDELYWNVTGHDWQMPIRNASARIVLPREAREVEAWAYTGYLGSQAQGARIAVEGSEVRVRASEPFAPREGLTVAVLWAPGVVARTPEPPPDRSLAATWPLWMALLAFLLMARQWWRQGREPRRGTIVVQYEPPAGLTPAEVGTLADHSVHPHDLIATLVDLAVRGYLLIEEHGTSGSSGEPDYSFHLVRHPSEWEELAAHERLTLEAMFEDDLPALTAAAAPAAPALAAGGALAARRPPGSLARVSLFLLPGQLARHAEKLREAIYARLIERGLYADRPDHVRVRYFVLVLLLAVSGLTVHSLTSDIGEGEPQHLLLGFGLTIASVVGFGLFMRARSPEGVRTLERVLGFRQFLASVEGDRYRRLVTSPEMFERYLPYAIALRVERRWAAAFEGRPAPNWYRGDPGTAFSAARLARGLRGASRQTGSAMRRSSGGGGGGRSGGGSGGGGGRGF